MSAKTFDLICAPRLCTVLVTAIRQHVAIEYPPGSADCAQAAREALLDVATKIESACQQQASVTLSRRLRTMLKIAVSRYCQQFDQVEVIQDLHASLLLALQGEAIDDRALGVILPLDQAE